MMTYILLRNNKERAPLGLDEIRKTGLRSYDLVWVEGQSVCWLNPAEIKELKDFVNIAVKADTAVSPVVEVKTSITEKEDITRFLPVEEKEEETPVPVEEKPLYQPVAETAIVFPNKQGTYKLKETVQAETKYEKPLGELKELYAKSLEQKMKKGRFRLQIPPQMRKAAVYAGLLVAGILAGILINNSGGKKNTLAEQQTTTTAPANSIDPAIQQASTDSVVIQATPYNPSVEEIRYSENEISEQPDRQPARKEQAPEIVSEKRTIPVVPEETKTRIEDVPKANKELSFNEMRSMVAVASNDYTVGSFGGIRDLELTVTNNSKYNLDHVLVELKYLKPRDEFIKAENISFYSIAPNDSKTVSVPKSTRGVKVSYKVIRVESKEISSTAGL